MYICKAYILSNFPGPSIVWVWVWLLYLFVCCMSYIGCVRCLEVPNICIDHMKVICSDFYNTIALGWVKISKSCNVVDLKTLAHYGVNSNTKYGTYSCLLIWLLFVCSKLKLLSVIQYTAKCRVMSHSLWHYSRYCRLSIDYRVILY